MTQSEIDQAHRREILNLDKTGFEYEFAFVARHVDAADIINSFHEDYPHFVDRTHGAISIAMDKYIDLQALTPTYLEIIHEIIFEGNWSFAGNFRELNVRVGFYQPPKFQYLEGYMKSLHELFKVTDIESLALWYKAFENIHPFQDGNGRVGGTIIAAYSHRLNPELGFMVPLQ